MERAAAVVATTIKAVDRRGWNFSFGKIVIRLVLRACYIIIIIIIIVVVVVVVVVSRHRISSRYFS
jgi:hypothetical protein